MKTYKVRRLSTIQCQSVTEEKTNSSMLKTNKSLH